MCNDVVMTPKCSGLGWLSCDLLQVPGLGWQLRSLPLLSPTGGSSYGSQECFDEVLNLAAPSLRCSWRGDSKREGLFNLLRNFSMYVGVGKISFPPDAINTVCAFKQVVFGNLLLRLWGNIHAASASWKDNN